MYLGILQFIDQELKKNESQPAAGRRNNGYNPSRQRRDVPNEANSGSKS